MHMFKYAYIRTYVYDYIGTCIMAKRLVREKTVNVFKAVECK